MGERVRRCRLAVGLAVAALLIPFAAPARAARPAAAAGGEVSAAQRGDFAGRVEIRGGRRLYLECRGRGRPTVILVSGYGNGADVWSLLDPGVRRPPVLAGVAGFTRACAYDRPNTILQPPDGRSRSDPVTQPRTAADAVAELHALLRAAGVRGPYVLVGHSLGGLFVRLYASTYPRQVAGLVQVDATYELLRELLTPSSGRPSRSQPPLPARRLRALRPASARRRLGVRLQAQRRAVDPARRISHSHLSGKPRPLRRRPVSHGGRRRAERTRSRAAQD
jgi:pimeloyl-ACP methyl ester carboxylesterase